jgi:DNA modification methylase
MVELNRIYNMDCMEGIKGVQDNIVDLVVTSPPYNVDLGKNKYNQNGYDVHEDSMNHADYIRWLRDIFGSLWDKLRDGGRVCINVGDGKNGAVPTHSDVIQMMTHDLDYLPMTLIIWDKSQTSNRTAWGSWMSPSAPSFPRGYEYILVFAKEKRKLQYKGESDIAREEFIKWTNGLWVFAPESKQKKYGHPAMFPEELPKRCIKMFSYKDAVVLDPFCGAGTTCKVAKDLGRNYIGFEISEEYCEIANKRISEAQKPDL